MRGGLLSGALGYATRVRHFKRNVHLAYSAAMLSTVAFTMFLVVFNLYILSLGIRLDRLGMIVAAEPLAIALAAVPAGFVAEKLGYRKSMFVILGVTGLTQLARVATTQVPLIMTAAFVGGLGSAASFVVYLPFLAANSDGSDREFVFTVDTVVMNLAVAVGAVLAGQAPNWIRPLTSDLTTAYRYTLYGAGLLSLLAILPVALVHYPPRLEVSKISLFPYLRGIDRSTAQLAIIALFRGFGLGLIGPFLNVFFIYRLGTTREFFSMVSALSIVPATAATLLAPVISSSMGVVGSITLLRGAISVPTVAIALTSVPLLAAVANWLREALSTMVQPLTFSFAMDVARPRARSAAAAWMHVAYVLGEASAAPLTGMLLARSSYSLPFYLSAVATLFVAVLNHAFFGTMHKRSEPDMALRS